LLAVNFTELTDDEFHEALMDANLTLVKNYHRKKLAQMTDTARDLYVNRNAEFRGFRQS